MLNDINSTSNVPVKSQDKKIDSCLLSLKDDINCLQNQITDLEQQTATERVIADSVTSDSIQARTAVIDGSLVSGSLDSQDINAQHITSTTLESADFHSTTIGGSIIRASDRVDTKDLNVTGNFQISGIQSETATTADLQVTRNANLSFVSAASVDADSAQVGNITSESLAATNIEAESLESKDITADSVTTTSATVNDDLTVNGKTTLTQAAADELSASAANIIHIDNKEIKASGRLNIPQNLDLPSQWVTFRIPHEWLNKVWLVAGKWHDANNEYKWSVSGFGSEQTNVIAWNQSALETIKDFSFDKTNGDCYIRVRAEDYITYQTTYNGEDYELDLRVSGPAAETLYIPETLRGYLFQSYNDDTTSFYFGGQVKLHSLKAEIQDFDWATYNNIGVRYNLRVPTDYNEDNTVKDWSDGKEGQYLTVRPRTYNGTTVNQLVWEDWINQTEGTVDPVDTLITSKTLAFYDGTSTGSGQEWDPTVTGSYNLKEVLIAAGQGWTDLEDLIDDQKVLTTQDISYYSGWKMIIGGSTVANEGAWTSAVITYPPNTLSSQVWLYVYNEGTRVASKQLGIVSETKVDGVVTRVEYSGIEEIQFRKTTDGYNIKNLGDGTVTHGDHSVKGDLQADGAIYNEYISSGVRDTTDQKDGSLVIQPSREYFYVSVTNTGNLAATLDPFTLRPKTDFSYGNRISEQRQWRWAAGISSGALRYDNVYYISYYNGKYYALSTFSSLTNGRAFEITKLEWTGSMIRLRTAKETAYNGDFYTYYNTDYDYKAEDPEWADIWASIVNPQGFAVTGTIDAAYIDGDISIFKKSSVDGTPIYNNVAIYDDAESVLENGKPVIYKAENKSLQTTDSIDIDSASIDDLTVDTIHARQGYFTKVTTTEEETISTGSDNIVLRQNNSTKLKDGQLSGIVVNNYDGNGKVSILGTDNDGTVRVGTAETATHSYDEIYYKNGKYYEYDEDNEEYVELTINGELVAFDSKSINEDDYTKYVNAVFAVFGTANTVPLAARDEDANMADQSLTIWDAARWTFRTIARPTTAEDVLVPYFDENNLLRYRWERKKAGVYTFATQADYEEYIESNNIPNDSIITITGENNYIYSEDRR